MQAERPKMHYQTHPQFYTYDIGRNSDISVDAYISDSLHMAVDFFKEHPKAFATFATKFINQEMLTYDMQGKTRVRLSLLSHRGSKLVDVRTDSVAKRLAALNDFYHARYDVHVNFSPFIFYKGWLGYYRELFKQLNEVVHPKLKEKMNCEVIFLTHNQWQHELNLSINPKAEEVILAPAIQETKKSQFGGINVRYQHRLKAQWINDFRKLQQEVIPWCAIH